MDEINNKIIPIWKRIIAFLIDGIILGLIGGVIYLLNISSTLNSIIFPISQFTYFISMTFVYGATVGKMLMKYSVVNVNSYSISLLSAILREIIRMGLIIIGDTLIKIDKNNIYLTTIFYILTFFIWLSNFFSKERRGIYDIIANTYLISGKLEKCGSLLRLNKFSFVVAISFFIFHKRTTSILFNIIVSIILLMIGIIIGNFFLDLLNRLSGRKLSKN